LGLEHAAIGGNMLVLETARDLVVIDCGLLFPDDEPGVDYIIPDVGYLLERRHKLRAYVLTHGHEDHIGALPFVAQKTPRPLRASSWSKSWRRLRIWRSTCA
jgi:ribonuclease J